MTEGLAVCLPWGLAKMRGVILEVADDGQTALVCVKPTGVDDEDCLDTVRLNVADLEVLSSECLVST